MPVKSFTALTPLAFLERSADVFADKTAIYTYEGTEHIQTLIVGRDITGVSAFV
jgi:hypothetical protein